MKNRNPYKSTILFAGPTVTIVAAVLLGISLVTFYVAVPYVIKAMVLKETRLVNGTDTWDKWTDVKVPILIKFYFFNVTNIEDAERGGRFQVQDVGPYVWEEKRTKQIVAVDEEEDTVTYKEVVWYYFRRDLSVGDQEDTVNMVNLPFIAASTLVYQILYSRLANYLIDLFVKMDETFVLRNVNIREVVFDGYTLPTTFTTLADFGIVDLPEEFIDGTFAFYNQKNGTPTEEYKVYRGVKNYQDFGKIVSYDNKKEVDWWTNSSLPKGSEQYCNKINGSDGSLFAPFVNKDKNIYAFSHEICRSIHLKFEKEVNYKGIPAYQFTPPAGLLADPKDNEDNKCFCPDPGHGLANYCAGGAIRIERCKKGIPIALSLPHFIHASQRIKEGVDGVDSDNVGLEINLIVEPTSGALLKIIKKLQIATEFQRLPGITAFKNITEAIVPIFWVEERAEPDDEYLADIRNRLVTPLEILKILQPTILGFLVFSLVLGILLSLCVDKSKHTLLQFEVVKH